jgi:hypothetical protein
MGDEDPSPQTKRTYHVKLRLYYTPVLTAGKKTIVTQHFKEQLNWNFSPDAVDSVKRANVEFMDVDDTTVVLAEADVTLPYHTLVKQLAVEYDHMLVNKFRDLDGVVGQVHEPGSSSVVNQGGRRKTRKRLMSRKYCKKTPCRRMGFTQKASCRPYKNCYQ